MIYVYMYRGIFVVHTNPDKLVVNAVIKYANCIRLHSNTSVSSVSEWMDCHFQKSYWKKHIRRVSAEKKGNTDYLFRNLETVSPLNQPVSTERNIPISSDSVFQVRQIPFQ